jgi:DNA replication protein DnaC
MTDIRQANAMFLQKRAKLARGEDATSIGEAMKNMALGVPVGTPRPGESHDERTRRLWAEARVPLRHDENRGAEDNAPAAWKAELERVVGQVGSGFLFALLGQRGTGKTQIAVLTLVRAIQLGRPSRYVSAMRAFLEIRATFKSEADTELSAIEQFITPSLLVIDEFQERGESPWEDRLLGFIVDERYAAQKDTLLISNLKPVDFAESAGPSIVSRLTECGGIVECVWESFRKRTAAAKGVA